VEEGNKIAKEEKLKGRRRKKYCARGKIKLRKS